MWSKGKFIVRQSEVYSIRCLTAIFEEKSCPDMPFDDNPGVLNVL